MLELEVYTAMPNIRGTFFFKSRKRKNVFLNSNFKIKTSFISQRRNIKQNSGVQGTTKKDDGAGDFDVSEF